jgi:hypothetical protein
MFLLFSEIEKSSDVTFYLFNCTNVRSKIIPDEQLDC